jgi:sulfhydrogenase subunit alpha
MWWRPPGFSSSSWSAAVGRSLTISPAASAASAPSATPAPPLRATEAALGIELTEQTHLLRLLIFNGEMISSHVLHVYFLVAPDLLGVKSVLPLVDTHPEVVLRAMRMKKLSYDLCAAIGGRHTHPVAMVPGGFTHVPKESDLAALRERLVACREDVWQTVATLKTLSFPSFERETEYISLTHPDRYAFYEGDVKSSDGYVVPATEYRSVVNEYIVPFSTAKHTRWHREAYAVGALARVNNNFDQLWPMAKEVAAELGFTVPCCNPYLNSVAQVIEIAHCVEDSIALIDQLLGRGLQRETPEVKPRAGRGVGAVEAPRGILFHEYEYDEQGKCVRANCVIPTNQNYGNLCRDMQARVPQLLDQPKERITLDLEMLVRSYDPCISCSTHLLNVTFVE